MEKLEPLVRADPQSGLPVPEGSAYAAGPRPLAAEAVRLQPPRLSPLVVFGLGTALGLFFVTEAFATSYVDNPHMPMADKVFTFFAQL
jgi:hypothetical protein